SQSDRDVSLRELRRSLEDRRRGLRTGDDGRRNDDEGAHEQWNERGRCDRANTGPNDASPRHPRTLSSASTPVKGDEGPQRRSIKLRSGCDRSGRPTEEKLKGHVAAGVFPSTRRPEEHGTAQIHVARLGKCRRLEAEPFPVALLA